VRKRLEDLEEKYKDLSSKKMAAKINKELQNDFCVDLRQLQNWKLVVKTVDNLNKSGFDEINFVEKIAPTILHEIAKAPEEKQVEIAEKVIEENLTVEETREEVAKAKGEPIIYQKSNYEIMKEELSKVSIEDINKLLLSISETIRLLRGLGIQKKEEDHLVKWREDITLIKNTMEVKE